MPEKDPLPSADASFAAPPDATTLLDRQAVLAAVSDPARLAMLGALARGEALSVSQLAARANRATYGASKHLRVLRAARLLRVVGRADGDGREQLHEVPPPFRTRDAAGNIVLDFGGVALRF